MEEKNPTIVNFPLRGVDFSDCKHVTVTSVLTLDTCLALFISLPSDVDAPASQPPTAYDLIANVTHESVAGTMRDKQNTVWKVQLRAGSGGGGNEKWLQIQDLIVEEIRKEMIFLGETVLQVRSVDALSRGYVI